MCKFDDTERSLYSILLTDLYVFTYDVFNQIIYCSVKFRFNIVSDGN